MGYFEIFSFHLLAYLLTYLGHQDFKPIFVTFFLGRKKIDKVNVNTIITVGVQSIKVLGTFGSHWLKAFRLGAFQSLQPF